MLKKLILIFLLALTIRVGYFAANFDGMDSLRGPDSNMYESLATSLLETGGFNKANGIPETERVPFYIAYLAVFQGLLGNSPIWPVVGQIIIDSITVLLIAVLAFNLNKKLGYLAGILAAINLNMIAHSALIFTDCIFLLFMTAALLFAVRYFQTPSFLTASITGLFLGFALLTRAVVMYYPLILISWIVIAARYNRVQYRKMIQDVCACCIIISLLVAPILIRNFNHFGYFHLVTQTGTHSLNWIVPLVLEYSEGKSFAASQDAIKEYTKNELKKKGLKKLPDNPFESSAMLSSMAKALLVDIGPCKILKAWVIGSAINLFSPAIMSVPRISRIERPSFYMTEGKTFYQKIFNFITHTKAGLFVLVFLVSGILTALVRVVQLIGVFITAKPFGIPLPPSLFLLATIGYFLAVTGPITGVKYRLPFEPILIIYLSSGLLFLYDRFMKKYSHA